MLNAVRFTKREEQVLVGLCEGRTNKEIGNPLGLTEKTVKGHVTQILKKLHCTNRTQAVIRWLCRD